MADLDNLVEELSKLTVLEAADLVKQLEDKWGVSAAAPVAVAAAGAPAAGGDAAPAEEKALAGRSGLTKSLQCSKLVFKIAPKILDLEFI